MLNWLKKLTKPEAVKPTAPSSSPSSPTDQVKEWMKVGFGQFQAENHGAALENFKRILQVQADNSDALYLAGVIEIGRGNNLLALDYISRAIKSDPSIASYYFSLAHVHSALGIADKAISSYMQAIRLDPEDAESRIGLSRELMSAGKMSEAVEQLQVALRLSPSDAQIHFNMGVALQATDQTQEAANHYSSALSIEPNHAHARNNLGALLHAQGKFDEAIDCFRHVVAQTPAFAQSWCNLGVALQAIRKTDEAETCLLQAIRLNANDFNAHSSLALIQRDQGRLTDSIASSKRALAAHDSFSECVRMATLTPVVAESAQEIQQWRLRFDREVTKLLTPKGTLSDPLKEVGACNFFLAYQPEGNKHLQQIVAQLYAAACPDLLYSAPHCLQYAPKAKEGRLRVGFISKFMHNHSIGRTTRGLLANLDRSRFHVSALFVPPLVDDFVSQFVRDSADDYVVLPSTLQAARLEIAALKLDVLFYQDIGMDAYTYFLAFSRLAPVQCVSFGHPDTTGIPNMDYWVSSENFELTSAADHYSEELFLLHNLGSLAYYYRPTLQPSTKTREEFGLPTDRHLYICPQALFKLHPDFDVIIAGILRGDPLGEVVLVEARTTSWNEQLQKRFQATIPDVVNRIRFVPGLSQDDFLSLIAVCDVMLDTIYFNGMNTSLEALAVGTPVVTMPTTMQRGRHTFGMYGRMGMTECIASTPHEYISIAQRLGTDTVFRQQVKGQILSRNGVLYEDMNVVREFERFFETAHQKRMADKNVTA
jgi:predicted O-linked N-acetylglucosamine transferase (SPINDLY family)